MIKENEIPRQKRGERGGEEEYIVGSIDVAENTSLAKLEVWGQFRGGDVGHAQSRYESVVFRHRL